MNVVFQFAGGPLDGKLVHGQTGGQGEADRYYALSYHGRIGQRFRTASQYAIDVLAQARPAEGQPRHFHQHIYRVTRRLEGGDGVLVRAEYVPHEPGNE